MLCAILRSSEGTLRNVCSEYVAGFLSRFLDTSHREHLSASRVQPSTTSQYLLGTRQRLKQNYPQDGVRT